ncbi:MAG: hypothetical protein ABFD98_08260 [Syntrophobacteraceae bacterium]|nr:hypothetical protein [Desulfobacteraceae bacterium]
MAICYKLNNGTAIYRILRLMMAASRAMKVYKMESLFENGGVWKVWDLELLRWDDLGLPDPHTWGNNTVREVLNLAEDMIVNCQLFYYSTEVNRDNWLSYGGSAAVFVLGEKGGNYYRVPLSEYVHAEWKCAPLEGDFLAAVLEAGIRPIYLDNIEAK